SAAERCPEAGESSGSAVAGHSGRWSGRERLPGCHGRGGSSRYLERAVRPAKGDERPGRRAAPGQERACAAVSGGEGAHFTRKPGATPPGWRLAVGQAQSASCAVDRAIAHSPAQHRGAMQYGGAYPVAPAIALMKAQLDGGPSGEQVDAGAQHQGGHRLAQSVGGGRIEQDAHNFTAALVTQQLRAHGLEIVGHLLTGAWDVASTEAFTDQGDFI